MIVQSAVACESSCETLLRPILRAGSPQRDSDASTNLTAAKHNYKGHACTCQSCLNGPLCHPSNGHGACALVTPYGVPKAPSVHRFGKQRLNYSMSVCYNGPDNLATSLGRSARRTTRPASQTSCHQYIFTSLLDPLIDILGHPLAKFLQTVHCQQRSEQTHAHMGNGPLLAVSIVLSLKIIAATVLSHRLTRLGQRCPRGCPHRKDRQPDMLRPPTIRSEALAKIQAHCRSTCPPRRPTSRNPGQSMGCMAHKITDSQCLKLAAMQIIKLLN